jgi:anti-sigma factor RsiW
MSSLKNFGWKGKDMNHRLFEDWLLSDEPLEPEQRAELQEHLETCESCTRLAAVWQDTEALLSSTPMQAPQPGFTQRWQSRFAADVVRRQRKQTMLMLAFYLGGALFLMVPLVLILWPVFFAPQPIILAMIYRLTSWFEAGQLVVDFVSTLLVTMLGVVPPTLWIGIGVAFTSLCVLLIVALRKLTSNRRVYT